MPARSSLVLSLALLFSLCCVIKEEVAAAQPGPATANTRHALRLPPTAAVPFSSRWGAVFQGDDGSDTRQPMTSNAFPWSAIGLVTLDNGNGIFDTCTGTLVGRRIMLTAAHCVLRDGKIHAITFSANYANGRNGGIAQSGWVTVGTIEPDTYRSADWAVVELDQPLGDSQGWMGTQALDDFSLPLRVAFAGYSDDFRNGNVAGAEAACTVHDAFRDGTYGHDCSEGPGGSGGPLFLTDEQGKVRVVAVNTRGVRNGVFSTYKSVNANIAVMSQALVSTVAEFRKNYP